MAASEFSTSRTQIESMCNSRKLDHSEQGINDRVSLITQLMIGLLLFIIQIIVINIVVVCLRSYSGGRLCRT